MYRFNINIKCIIVNIVEFLIYNNLFCDLIYYFLVIILEKIVRRMKNRLKVILFYYILEIIVLKNVDFEEIILLCILG